MSIDVHSEAVWCLTGLENGSIHLWTVRQEEGSCVHTYTAHAGPVSSIKIAPNEKSFLSGSWDKMIKLWSLEDGSLLQEFGPLKSQVTSISFHPTSDTLFLASSFDGSVYIFDINEPDEAIAIPPFVSAGWCLSVCFCSFFFIKKSLKLFFIKE
jgi:transcriptional activator SPT8